MNFKLGRVVSTAAVLSLGLGVATAAVLIAFTALMERWFGTL